MLLFILSLSFSWYTDLAVGLKVAERVNQTGDSCVPAGQLLFLHIMKTGGSSIEEFLNCHLLHINGSMVVVDGNVSLVKGKTSCKSRSVCSTHASYQDRVEVCGEDFKQPNHTLAVFRDPVARVFSFYNYNKAKHHSDGVKALSIAELYEKCDKGDEHVVRYMSHVCQQMMNHMVSATFAAENVGYPFKLQEKHLSQAKKQVRALSATLFIEDKFMKIQEVFDEANMLPPRPTHGGHIPQCHLLHWNEASGHPCPSCADAPTKEEVALIQQHNSFDIELFHFALGSPNRIVPN